MKAILVLILLTMFAVQAFATKPIEGAFGIELGGKFTTRAKQPSYRSGFKFFRFEPVRPLAPFENYEVLVTPKTSLVAGIAASVRMENLAKCRRARDDVAKTLRRKHGRFSRPKAGDPHETRNAFGKQAREVVGLSCGVSDDGPGRVLLLQYTSVPTFKLIQSEQRVPEIPSKPIRNEQRSTYVRSDASPTHMPLPVECPATGDSVTFRKVQEVYASMADLTKGEFETTAQFEARKAEAMAAADFHQPVLLEGQYDPGQVEYDADNQVFVMKTYAWDNMGIGWDEVFGFRNPYRIGPLSSFAPVQGVGLAQDEKVVRSYRASNSFGTEVTVGVVERTVYGVFDRPLPRKPGSGLNASKPEWNYQLTTGEYNSPTVVIPVPLQHAAEMKNKMRVGVMVRPKEPFTATGERHWLPKIHRPTETNQTTNLIVADILCAVITDQDGVVLKTVAPGG